MMVILNVGQSRSTSMLQLWILLQRSRKLAVDCPDAYICPPHYNHWNNAGA